VPASSIRELLAFWVGRILAQDAVDLTTEELTKRIDLPLAWKEQRALMGFD
jgi:hypothetical protein